MSVVKTKIELVNVPVYTTRVPWEADTPTTSPTATTPLTTWPPTLTHHSTYPTTTGTRSTIYPNPKSPLNSPPPPPFPNRSPQLTSLKTFRSSWLWLDPYKNLVRLELEGLAPNFLDPWPRHHFGGKRFENRNGFQCQTDYLNPWDLPFRLIKY